MEGRLSKRLIRGKVSPLQTWEVIASVGLKFRSLTLEVLVQPCIPPLKREAGKPEGEYMRSKVEGNHKEKMKAHETETTGVARISSERRGG